MNCISIQTPFEQQCDYQCVCVSQFVIMICAILNVVCYTMKLLPSLPFRYNTYKQAFIHIVCMRISEQTIQLRIIFEFKTKKKRIRSIWTFKKTLQILHSFNILSVYRNKVCDNNRKNLNPKLNDKTSQVMNVKV